MPPYNLMDDEELDPLAAQGLGMSYPQAPTYQFGDQLIESPSDPVPAPAPSLPSSSIPSDIALYLKSRDDEKNKTFAANNGMVLNNMVQTMTGQKGPADNTMYANMLKDAQSGPKEALEFSKMAKAARASDPKSPESIRAVKQWNVLMPEYPLKEGGVSAADLTTNKDMVSLALRNQLFGKKLDWDAQKFGVEQKNNATKLDLEKQKIANDANKSNSDQAKAALFASRMEQAEKAFADISKTYDRSSREDQASRLAKPETLYNENQRLNDQAERNFLNAVLRRESGAAIGKDEFTQGEKQYFVRPGDTPKVIEQKRQNRQLAIEAMKAEAGPAMTKIKPVAPKLTPEQRKALIEKIRAQGASQ